VCVPVQILSHRHHATERYTYEYQVLYNDAAKLWIDEWLLYERAPTLINEWIEAQP
jgi:hypothetical protein